MADDKTQGSGGNAKYVLIGLLLLGGAVGLYLVATSKPPPAPAPAPPPPAQVERVNPMAQPALVLEDETPDAGKPVEAAPELPKKRPSGPRAGEWECSGDLPSALAVVNANRIQVRSCYERRLKMNNVLQGDMTLRLKVGSTGKVTATQVGGTLHDKETFECVKKLASGWTFPVPEGGACAVVQVPFRFSPKNP